MEYSIPCELKMSRHGAVRSQQRGIPPLVIDLLIGYGAEARIHGATRYFMDKAARRRVERAVGDQVMRRIGDMLDAMVVVGDDGTIVTAGHRTHRIYR